MSLEIRGVVEGVSYFSHSFRVEGVTRRKRNSGFGP